MSARPTYTNVFGCSSRFWKSLKWKCNSIPFPFLQENNMYMSVLTLVILEPGPITSPVVHLFSFLHAEFSSGFHAHSYLTPRQLTLFWQFHVSAQTIISHWEDPFPIPHHKIILLLSLFSHHFPQTERFIHFFICMCHLICIKIQFYCDTLHSCSLSWFIC